MEARRLSTSTSSCFASVGPLFPFLPRGFPARWHAGMPTRVSSAAGTPDTAASAFSSFE